MSASLPPLKSLRAFEAAARNLSISRAAEELHVTPAAVSQQIKLLEAHLGVPLFRRLTRALALTEAGQAALPPLREAFDKLHESLRRVEALQESGLLTISVSPSLCEKWLLPRLERFRSLHPEYELRIDATDRLADFTRDGVDLALRYGRGRYPGLQADCILTDVAFPVCAPQLLDGATPLRKPEDLRRHNLIHVEWEIEGQAAPNWRMWLHAAGVEGVDLSRGFRFGMEHMALSAAIEGQGVALATASLVADDLAAGRLVRPFSKEIEVETAFRYYLVYPAEKADHARTVAFRNWVLSEVPAMEKAKGD